MRYEQSNDESRKTFTIQKIFVLFSYQINFVFSSCFTSFATKNYLIEMEEIVIYNNKKGELISSIYFSQNAIGKVLIAII